MPDVEVISLLILPNNIDSLSGCDYLLYEKRLRPLIQIHYLPKRLRKRCNIA
jgi:hypothetical protein